MFESIQLYANTLPFLFASQRTNFQYWFHAIEFKAHVVYQIDPTFGGNPHFNFSFLDKLKRIRLCGFFESDFFVDNSNSLKISLHKDWFKIFMFRHLKKKKCEFCSEPKNVCEFFSKSKHKIEWKTNCSDFNLKTKWTTYKYITGSAINQFISHCNRKKTG